MPIGAFKTGLLAAAGSGAAGFVAFGGLITQYVHSGTTYRVHTFRGSGRFYVASGEATVSFYNIGGGGAGGSGGSSSGSGGGGAGGDATGTFDAEAGNYAVTVGKGAFQTTSYNIDAYAPVASAIAGVSGSTAAAGGSGGRGNYNAHGQDGYDGASGGGAGNGSNGYNSGVVGTGSDGYNGGLGTSSSGTSMSGGGGGGTYGDDVQAVNVATLSAGAGIGSSYDNDGNPDLRPTDGTPNTGSGGGGGSVGYVGGHGGTGIVILRYEVAA